MNDDHAAPGDGAGEGSAPTQPSSERQQGPAEFARRPATRYELWPPRRHRLLQAVAGATPGIEVLRHYRRGWLRSDVYAGISVVAYIVPQVMAYTALVGVPPVVGLWTALAALIVYAALGSSRVLSVGPESTIALMAGTAIAPLAGADPDRAVALARRAQPDRGRVVSARTDRAPRRDRRSALPAAARRLSRGCGRADGRWAVGQDDRHDRRGRQPRRSAQVLRRRSSTTRTC